MGPSPINTKGSQASPLDFKTPTSDCQNSFNEKESSVQLNSKDNIGHVHAIVYSLVDLQAATGSFNSRNLLGKGSIGSFYKAKYADGKVSPFWSYPSFN